MVVGPHADKAQQLFTVGDGHSADAGFFLNDGGQARAVFLVETLHQDADRAFGDAQGLGRKGNRIFFQRFAPIQNQAHEQGGAKRVGQHHGQGDLGHQTRRLVVGLGQQQNNGHLRQLCDQRGAKGNHRIEQAVSLMATQQIQVQGAADQALGHGGHRTGRGRETAH